MKTLVYVLAALTFSLKGCARTAPSEEHFPDAGVSMQAATVPPAHHASARATGGELIEGTVLEVIQVPKYSYLKIGVEDGRERWVAISSKEVARGSKVSVLAETTLTHFESRSLHRTFDEISFGSVYDPSKLAATGDSCPTGNSTVDLGGVSAARGHDNTSSDTSDVTIRSVPRATGKNAHTIAETISMRGTLSGKSVRIRAVVVKTTYEVLGKTFIHLRDGTGDANAHTNDLTATTSLRPNKGDTMLIEGTLAIDKDFGSGYRFDALLENAEVVAP